jgi:hypothetical protein
MPPIPRSLLAVLALAAFPAPAAIVFNEILLDPPGSDNGQEYIELRSTTGGVESMAGLTMLYIDGDGNNRGTIDMAVSLTGFSTGTNGLFLWRDGPVVLQPAPDPATVLFVQDWPDIGDLENGSFTLLLVTGFVGSVGLDLDINDDGVLDSLPWVSVVDALGFIENDGANNAAYAAALGGVNLGPFIGYNPDAFIRDSVTGEWLAGDVIGTSPGPYFVDATRNNFGATGTEMLTPGGVNIPEPSSGLLFLATGVVMGFSRGARR